MVRDKEELTVGERSLWDSRASLSRLSCSTSSWAWVMAGFSQRCTSRPASCSRASRAAPFTWLTWWEEEEERISRLAGSTLRCPPPLFSTTVEVGCPGRQDFGGGSWTRAVVHLCPSDVLPHFLEALV